MPCVLNDCIHASHCHTHESGTYLPCTKLSVHMSEYNNTTCDNGVLLPLSSLLLRGFDNNWPTPLILLAQGQLIHNNVNIGGCPHRRVPPQSNAATTTVTVAKKTISWFPCRYCKSAIDMSGTLATDKICLREGGEDGGTLQVRQGHRELAAQ